MSLVLQRHALEIMILVDIFLNSIFLNLKYIYLFSILLDFGVENLIELIKETNFPWLMSNVVDSETKKPLALANTKHVIDFNGLKVDNLFYLKNRNK